METLNQPAALDPRIIVRDATPVDLDMTLCVRREGGQIIKRFTERGTVVFEIDPEMEAERALNITALTESRARYSEVIDYIRQAAGVDQASEILPWIERMKALEAAQGPAEAVAENDTDEPPPSRTVGEVIRTATETCNDVNEQAGRGPHSYVAKLGNFIDQPVVTIFGFGPSPFYAGSTYAVEFREVDPPQEATPNA